MRNIIILAAATALGAGSIAFAQNQDGQDHQPATHGEMAQQHENMAQRHENMAEHHEGMSKDDMAFSMMFDSRLEQAFSAIDADDNENISRAEWGVWQGDEGIYTERFDHFDRNGNDVVEWEEYRSAARAMYDISSLTE